MASNAVRNVQAALVLIGTMAAWVLVPHEVLRPLALVLLAFAVGAVLGVRAYLRRLHEVVGFLESTRHSYRTNALAALLTEPERLCLGLGPFVDAEQAIGTIRKGQALITRAGVSIGIVGLGAFLITLLAFAD